MCILIETFHQFRKIASDKWFATRQHQKVDIVHGARKSINLVYRQVFDFFDIQIIVKPAVATFQIAFVCHQIIDQRRSELYTCLALGIITGKIEHLSGKTGNLHLEILIS